MPAVYTIPPHRAFADALAAGLLARHGEDRLALARGLILLPNNRAVRAVTDAFVRRAEGGLLLPRLMPIGDPELGERLGALFEPADADPVPPAIDPVRRRLILARLVIEASPDPLDAAEAMRLAADLARVLDQLAVEDVSPQALEEAVPAELSSHWERSLAVLRTILRRWPEELARRGLIDLADRRNRLLRQVEHHWRTAAPAVPVIAAGITVAAPAVARLLRRVSRMERGAVVLPGLDLAMPAAEWEALGPDDDARAIESHPQFELKRLLDAMDVGRGEVRLWPYGGGRDAPAVRTRAIGNALAPAAFTAKWQRLASAERRLTGVRAAEFATPSDEAQGIAIALREAAERPGETAALVTPDRALAMRVSAHLRRWGIEADDSAGRPLADLPAGTLLLSIAEAVAEGFAPVPLVALLKHPLVAGGEGRLAWLEGVRAIDRALRGPRPGRGLAGLDGALAKGPAVEAWARMRPLVAPLDTLTQAAEVSLAEAVAALREAAQRLAGDEAWARPAGRAAAELIAALEAAAEEGPRTIRPASMPDILRQLLREASVRPPQGGHPRISIWGLIEARLQQADLMVLGGLNEGVWPAQPAPDPWLAPAIRQALGLPGLERRIGVQAHDLAGALGGRRVLVTRARRDARAPAIASRFWLRMEAMTGGLTRAPLIGRWAEALDRPTRFAPADRPKPSPPVADRPKRIAVTRLDRLKADPFAFYAGQMLKLGRLDAIDADPTPAWRGSAVHAVFEAWMEEDRCDPTKLRARAERMLAEAAPHPVLRALWTPRLLEAIEWVAARMEALRREGRAPIAAERKGRVEAFGVTLEGTADRIDRLEDGSLAIVDYKTGQPPAPKAVAAGYAMQLGLLGLIADMGGFGPDVTGRALAFEYWSLASAPKGGGLGHVSTPVGPKRGTGDEIVPEEFTTLAARQLVAAVEAYLLGETPFVAKLHPEHAPYDEYDQLMRLDEWYGRTGQ